MIYKNNNSILLSLFILLFSIIGICEEQPLVDAIKEYNAFFKDFNKPDLSSIKVNELDIKSQQLIQKFQNCEKSTQNKIKELAKISEIDALNENNNEGGTNNQYNFEPINNKIEKNKKNLIECRLKVSALGKARLKLIDLKKTRWIDGLLVKHGVWNFLNTDNFNVNKTHLEGFIPISKKALILILLFLAAYFFMWFKSKVFYLEKELKKLEIGCFKATMLSLLKIHLMPFLLAMSFWFVVEAPHKNTLLMIIFGLMIRDLCLLLPIKMLVDDKNKASFTKFINFSTGLILITGYFWKAINYEYTNGNEWLVNNSLLISPLFILITLLFAFNCLYFYRLLKRYKDRYLPMSLMIFSSIIFSLYLGSYAQAAQYLMVMCLSIFMVHLSLKIVNSLRKIILSQRLSHLKIIEKQQDKDPITYAFPFWVSLITSLVSGFLSLAFLSWVGGVSAEAYRQISFFYYKGFDVGSLNIVPSNIFIATIIIIIFIILLTILRHGIEYQWFNKSRLRKESREVVAMLIWYLGITIIALIGLSIAGFDISNLAIVAGALSVGIGFGLQNIVSNFVSGLILLFERPVKKGDWVEVAGTVGFIQKVKIRATTIKTFDNAEILVPNSELLSHHVTNWTLSNSIGRVIIKVGVAYGSDTKKVKDILMQVAKDHALVINYSPYQSKVHFREFGDSSLNFELRVMIRDITKFVEVQSDLNFEIDRLFRESGISIPFPQRDLHVIDSVPFGFKNRNSHNQEDNKDTTIEPPQIDT